MPTKLDAHLVETSLSALTEWQGDTERIRRTVQLSDTQAEQVLANVTVAADAMNHHPVVNREGGQVAFELWTHSEGGVTELDIALASRIDDFIGQATGAHHRPEGQVGGVVVSDERDTAEFAERLEQPHDTYEPVIGVPTTQGGSPGAGGGSVIPDPEPFRPEPGIEPEQTARPEEESR